MTRNHWAVLTIAGMEHYSIALFTRNGWMAEEVKVLLALVRKEVLSNKLHAYTKAYVGISRSVNSRLIHA